jgi:hypothetical protein
MFALQRRLGRHPSASAAFMVPPPAEVPGATEQRDVWPLLVLDPGLIPNAGEFLTRCRWCGWTSPRQATPKAALAAFVAHSCQERPA